MDYIFPNNKKLPYSSKIYDVVAALKELTKFPNYAGKLVISDEDKRLRLTQTDLFNILTRLSKLPTGIEDFASCKDLPYLINQGSLVSGCGCDKKTDLYSQTPSNPKTPCNQFVVDYDEQKLLEFADAYISMGRERKRQLKHENSSVSVFFPPGQKVVYQNKRLFFNLADGSFVSASFANSPQLRPLLESFWELRKRKEPGTTVFETQEIFAMYKELFDKSFLGKLSDYATNIRQLVFDKNHISKDRFKLNYDSPGKWTFWVK